MRLLRFIIPYLMLVFIIVTCGCIHTPAKVAEETPHVLKNVSDEISAMETPNITLEGVIQSLNVPVNYTLPVILINVS